MSPEPSPSPGAVSQAASQTGEGLLVPLPTSSFPPPVRSSSTLTPLICDERAILRLLEMLLSRAGLSIPEAAKRLGVADRTLRQYLRGRRNRPSLLWFVRLASVCGARVTVEFPR